MYDENYYEDEVYDANEGTKTIMIVVGAFVLMVLLIYLKYKQTYGF